MKPNNLKISQNKLIWRRYGKTIRAVNIDIMLYNINIINLKLKNMKKPINSGVETEICVN